jgi:Xaa-Pro aminopeptidase
MGIADPVPREVARRVADVQSRLREDGLDALIVYGNTKASGGLRYLTNYYVDRTGWVSLGPSRDDIFIFDGAGVVVPAQGDPVLLVEPGMFVDVEPVTEDWRAGGLTPHGADGLTSEGVAAVLREMSATSHVGIENWDRLPAPLYLGLTEVLPSTDFSSSTVVEEVRLIKSAYEIEMFRMCGEVADAGHASFVEALRDGRKSELELVRAADGAMRAMNPTYEDAVPASPSKICSGTNILGNMLHAPLPDKLVQAGDIVNWDVCARYMGYCIDTSRTRCVGEPTQKQAEAYDVVLEMSRAVRDAARPGAVTTDLVQLAKDIARDGGYQLWENFLGHGIGLDTHERPDMGVEKMTLRENMVITVEPRIVVDDGYLLGNEDMVLVTPDGGRPFGSYPREPLML